MFQQFKALRRLPAKDFLQTVTVAETLIAIDNGIEVKRIHMHFLRKMDCNFADPNDSSLTLITIGDNPILIGGFLREDLIIVRQQILDYQTNERGLSSLIKQTNRPGNPTNIFNHIYLKYVSPEKFQTMYQFRNIGDKIDYQEMPTDINDFD